MTISLEVRALYERVRFNTVKSVADSLRYATGSNARLMGEVLEDLQRASLFHEMEGERSVRPKLRAVRQALGLSS